MTTRTPPRERLAALDAATLVYEDGAGLAHARPVPADALPDALALLTMMERFDLRQLWVHPAFVAARHLTDWPAGAYLRAAVTAGWTLSETDLARWVVCFHSGTFGARHLVLPGLEDRCDWRAAKDARELLRAVQLYRDALGGNLYRRTPGATGTSLMRALHTGPRATELAAPPEMPPPATQAGTETAWQWIRPLTADERARRYVHAYDRNGAYLASCAALPLGVGTAEHVRAHDMAWPLLRDGLPGYWRIVLPATPASRLLPDLTAAHRPDPAAGGAWMTTPAARLLLDTQGDGARVAEAWVWRQHARYLEPWYKLLRDGRRSLMDRSDPSPVMHQDDAAPAVIALDALKATYAHSIGWLAGSWEREAARDGHAGVLYRPDWRHAIIATANANLYRRVVKAATAQPDFVPFAINHDCIYVASDNLNAELACPDGAFTLGRNLGDWKIVHNGIPLAGMRDALSGDAPRLSAFLAALRTVAKAEATADVR